MDVYQVPRFVKHTNSLVFMLPLLVTDVIVL